MKTESESTLGDGQATALIPPSSGVWARAHGALTSSCWIWDLNCSVCSMEPSHPKHHATGSEPGKALRNSGSCYDGGVAGGRRDMEDVPDQHTLTALSKRRSAAAFSARCVPHRGYPDTLLLLLLLRLTCSAGNLGPPVESASQRVVFLPLSHHLTPFEISIYFF